MHQMTFIKRTSTLVIAAAAIGAITGYLIGRASAPIYVFQGDCRIAELQPSPTWQATVHTSGPASLVALHTKYLHLVEMAVTGSLHDEAGRCNAGDGNCGMGAATLPYDPEMRRKGDDWPPFGHTMVGHLRLNNIREVLTSVVKERIPGHFAELGVWRGGACIYAKAVMETLGAKNMDVFVFDAFDAIPSYDNYAKFLATKESTVRHNFNKYELMDEHVHFERGLFKDTVPAFRRKNPNMQLAVLRVDGNFYDSHQDVFYYLYEMVPVGGYIIFDDIMSHAAVQEAWADFRKDQNFEEEIIPIDNHCGYFRKSKAIKVDMSKMHPAKDTNKKP